MDTIKKVHLTRNDPAPQAREDFVLETEMSKTKHPEVTEMVWIEYDLMQKKSGVEWQS